MTLEPLNYVEDPATVLAIIISPFFLPTQHNLSNSADLKELAMLLQSKDPLRSTEHTHTETDKTDVEEK